MSKNIAASVRQRLMNLNREKGQQQDFQKLLRLYALERLLYRLSQSDYKDTYILKGALLFSAWMGQPHRVTQDLDLLGLGNNTIQYLKQVFQDICRVSVEDDGLVFQSERIQGMLLQAGQKYEGVRLKLMVTLGNAQIPLQVDIGFGHAVTPAPEVVAYPTLLNFPAPSVKAYPPQTVIAEKFQAMVMLEMNNSRMKDFYDLWFLGRDFSFEGQSLTQAFRATFERRSTPLPTTTPVALTPEFSLDPAKQYEWQNFLTKNRLLGADRKSLSEVTKFLQDFLMPPSLAAAEGKVFNQVWSVGGAWSQNELEQEARG